MTKVTIADLEGGAPLCAWFGGTPSFHDATLRELELHQGKPGRLVAHTFRMASETDAQGYFLLTHQVEVTFTIYDLIEVELFDVMEAGIMFGLDVEVESDAITLNFDSSYGVHGRIKAKRIAVSFEPKNAK